MQDNPYLGLRSLNDAFNEGDAKGKAIVSRFRKLMAGGASKDMIAEQAKLMGYAPIINYADGSTEDMTEFLSQQAPRTFGEGVQDFAAGVGRGAASIVPDVMSLGGLALRQVGYEGLSDAAVSVREGINEFLPMSNEYRAQHQAESIFDLNPAAIGQGGGSILSMYGPGALVKLGAKAGLKTAGTLAARETAIATGKAAGTSLAVGTGMAQGAGGAAEQAYQEGATPLQSILPAVGGAAGGYLEKFGTERIVGKLFGQNAARYITKDATGKIILPSAKSLPGFVSTAGTSVIAETGEELGASALLELGKTTYADEPLTDRLIQGQIDTLASAPYAISPLAIGAGFKASALKGRVQTFERLFKENPSVFNIKGVGDKPLDRVRVNPEAVDASDRVVFEKISKDTGRSFEISSASHEGLADMARQIANNAGIRVVFIQEGAAAEGAEAGEGAPVMGTFDQGSNTLYINSDAPPEMQAIFGLMHETLHSLAKSDPRGVQGLFDRIESVFGQRFADYAEAVAATYKKNGVSDEAAITEEGFVNFLTQSMYGYMSAALTDQNEMRALAYADPGLFRDIISTFGSWADSLTGKKDTSAFDRDAAEAVAYKVNQYNRAAGMTENAAPGQPATAMGDFRFAQEAIESIQKMLGDRGARMEVARRTVADVKAENTAISDTTLMWELAGRLGITIPEAMEVYDRMSAGGRTALTEAELMVAAQDRLTPVGEEMLNRPAPDFAPPVSEVDFAPTAEEQQAAAAAAAAEEAATAKAIERLVASVAFANEIGSKTGYEPIEVLQGNVTKLMGKASPLSDAEKKALVVARDEWSRAGEQMKSGETAETIAARAAEIQAFDRTELEKRRRIENETALERVARLRGEAEAKAKAEAAAKEQAAQEKTAAQAEAKAKAEEEAAKVKAEREAASKTKEGQSALAKAKAAHERALEVFDQAARRVDAAEAAGNEKVLPQLRTKMNEAALAARATAKAYIALDATVADTLRVPKEPVKQPPKPPEPPKPTGKPKPEVPGTKPTGTTPGAVKGAASKPAAQSQSTIPFEQAAKAQENLQIAQTLRRLAAMPADQLEMVVAQDKGDLAELVGKSQQERVAWLEKKAAEYEAASTADQNKYALFVKIGDPRTSYTPTTSKSAPLKAMMDFIGAAFDGDLPYNSKVPTVTDKAAGGKVRTIAKMMRDKLGVNNAINWRAAADAGFDSKKYRDVVDESSDRMVDVVRAAINEFPMWQSWYRERLNVAMNIFKDMDPAMEQPENQFAMKVFLAVTSNGEEVQGQTDKSYELYLLYKQYGSFSAALANAKFEFSRESAMEKAFLLMDAMVESKGWESVSQFLLKSGTVQQLRDELVSNWGFTKKDATKATSGELIDEKIPYGLVFGPKIGSFFNNLSGQFDTTTMDRWFMRTFGRTMGTQLERRPGKVKEGIARIALTESQVDAADLAQLYKDAGVTKSMPVRDRAAAIWKYFQDKEARVGWDSKDDADPKSNVRRAYNSYVKVMDGFELVEAPRGAKHRRYIRHVMADTIKKMEERHNWTATPAELQALLWYYEKEVHEEFGSGETENPDYGTAAQKTFERVTYRARQEKWYEGFTRVQGPQVQDAQPRRATRVAAVPSADAPSYVESGLVSRRAKSRAGDGQRGAKDARAKAKEKADYRSVSALQGFAAAKAEGAGQIQYALKLDGVTGIGNESAFRKWFGKSKVVDIYGRPEIVYHLSTSSFDQFRAEGKPVKGKYGKIVPAGPGVWFSPNPSTTDAMNNVGGLEGKWKEGAQTYPVYLSIQNPYIIPLEWDNYEEYKKVKNAGLPVGINSFTEEQKRKLQSPPYNHDGMVFYDPLSEKAIEWVAFNPSQIKSAIGNKGEFSSEDPRMMYALRVNKDLLVKPQQLLEAAQLLRDGKLTAQQYEAVVDRYRPITPYDEAPRPAKLEEIYDALTEDKRPKILVPSKTLKKGHAVKLRLDIPAYQNHGVWVATVHEPRGAGVGEVIGYEPTAAITDAKFEMSQKAGLAIAAGKGKTPFAAIEGKWSPMTSKAAYKAAQGAMKDRSWAQVGMDPWRHGYFYDRSTRQPIVSASEVIQVGPLVLAKDPVYGSKKDFLYALKVPGPKGVTQEEADAYKKAYANSDKKTAKAIKDRIASRLGLWKAYHGTPGDRFNSFNTSLRGAATGANSAKNAFFASSKKKVADTYRDVNAPSGDIDTIYESNQYALAALEYMRSSLKEMVENKDGKFSIDDYVVKAPARDGEEQEYPWKIVSSYPFKMYQEFEGKHIGVYDHQDILDTLIQTMTGDWVSSGLPRFVFDSNGDRKSVLVPIAQFDSKAEAVFMLGKIQNRLDEAIEYQKSETKKWKDIVSNKGVLPGARLDLWVKMTNPRIVQGGGPGVYNEIKFNAEVIRALVDGNDGVIFKNVDDTAGRQEIYSDIYAFFNAEQAKFQDVFELDDSGNLIPLDKQFDFTNNDMRYALRVPYFASGIDRTDPLNFTTIDSPTAGWFVKQFVDYMQPVRAVAKSIEQVAKESGGALAKWSEEMDVSAKLDLYRNLMARYMDEGKDFINNSAAALAEGNIPLNREAGDAAGNTNVSAEEYLIAKHAERRNAVLLQDTLDKDSAYRAAEAAGNAAAMASIKARLVAADPSIQSLSGMTNADARAILARAKDPAYQKLSKAMQSIQRRKLELGVTYGLMSKAQADAWQKKYGPDYVPLKTTILDPNEQYLGGSGFVIRGKESKAAKGRTTLADDILGHAVTDYSAMAARGMKNMVGNAFYKMAVENPNPAWTLYDSRDAVPVDSVSRIFVTKIDGEEKILTINNAEMVRAMRNMDMADMGRGLAFASMASRMFTKLQTAWNPAFIAPNFVRDLGLALTLTGVDESTGAAWRVAKNIPAAIGTIFAEQFGRKAGSLDREYRELKQQGGLTGYAQYYSVADAAKALELEAESIRGGTSMPAKYLKGVAGLMEKLNAVAERATRLAVYKEARDRGLSQMKAAEVAVNITVNFSRRGNTTPVMNTLYPFFNASIQGVDNLSKRMFWSERSTPRQKRRMIAAIGSISTLGYIFSAIARGAGGDDEDGENAYKQVPEYDLTRNMILMKPDGSGDRYRIPLPWGLSLAYFVGAQAERMAAGDEDAREASGRILRSTIENLSPINGATWSQAIAPTLVDPIVQIAENQNFAGAKIMPDRNPYDKTPSPDSQLKFKTVNPVAAWAAETMNEWTGGSARKAGVVDVSPESIEHLSKFMGGGAGAYIYGIGDGLAKMFTGQEMTVEETPVVGDIAGRFVTTEDPDRKTKTEFFDNMRKFAMLREDLADPETRAEARKTRLRGLDSYTTSVDAKLRDLRERQKTARTEEMAKRIEAQMVAIMRRYNQRYNRLAQQ